MQCLLLLPGRRGFLTGWMLRSIFNTDFQFMSSLCSWWLQFMIPHTERQMLAIMLKVTSYAEVCLTAVCVPDLNSSEMRAVSPLLLPIKLLFRVCTS